MAPLAVTISESQPQSRSQESTMPLATVPLSVAAAAEPATQRRTRMVSVDLLRGAVMILMALDHTRDYFGDAAASPTNLATASTALFLTRWVTHFCAPVFFLLTGVGAYLARGQRTPSELSRFLLTRGLWLVVLELTVMRALWQFNLDYRLTILTVLWALGWSIVALAGISRLPLGMAVALGAGLIALHNLADAVPPGAFGTLAPLWSVLHQPGPLLVTERVFVLLAYPLIPWIGVTAVGFGLGRVLTWPTDQRLAFLLRLGVGLVAAFVLLRAVNLYGDPLPWSPQGSTLRTVLSFVNTNKYPPSLLFLLMTLGPAVLALRFIEGHVRAGGTDRADRGLPSALQPVLVFGRVPLFFYLLHVLIIHGLAVGASAVRFHAVHWMFESPTPTVFP